MEKFPFGGRPEPRVVGRGSPEDKEKAKQEIMERFGERHLMELSDEKIEKLRTEEREKTAVEREAIEAANGITNKLLERFDSKPFDIPEKNIHFVSDVIWNELKGAELPSMTAASARQAIFVRAATFDNKPDSGTVLMAQALLHEMSHLKAHTAIEVDPKGKDIYRFGWDIAATYKKTDRSGFALWFLGLHEAVVSEIEKRYSQEMLFAMPTLREEAKWLESDEARKFKEEVEKVDRVPAEEIAWISRDGERYSRFPYQKQRRVLDYVVDVLYADGELPSREDVMGLFFRAQFDGRLLDVARRVEKSFGPGAFRILGTMDVVGDNASAGRVLDDLMKRRRKIEKAWDAE